jgi:hypothetical protein
MKSNPMLRSAILLGSLLGAPALQSGSAEPNHQMAPIKGACTLRAHGGPASIGPDGVAEIYPTIRGGTEWHLDLAAPYSDRDGQVFNISYGMRSRFPFTAHPAAHGDPLYFNTRGSRITYNSGSAPGRSVRLDVYPAGGWAKNGTPFSWRDNPGYLYQPPSEESGHRPGGIRSREFTAYIRPHQDLGTHHAFAFKVGGRDQDEIRSAIEMVYPTSTHNKFLVNYNYAHFPYVAAGPVVTHYLPPPMTDGIWVGVKLVQKVAADRKSSHLEMWVDPAPFTADGKPRNAWRLAAEYQDTGPARDYVPPVPVTWACQKDVLRLDGFDNIDFTLLSDRAIDPQAAPVKSDS